MWYDLYILQQGLSRMFHTYAQASTKRMIDFDRATYLMDQDLLRQALEACDHEKTTAPRPDADYGVQWLWDEYCHLHREKYDAPFKPDVDPTWDS